MSLISNKNLEEPLYYHREYSNDLLRTEKEPTMDKDQEAPLYQRVAFAALPFIGLCKPLSMPFSLGMGSLRVISNLSALYSLSQQGNTENLPYQLLQTTIAITALAGTILAHPIGIFITTGQDIIIEITNLAGCLQSSEYFKAAESSANVLNNVLYLSMCLTGGIELSIASLAVQILLGLYHSQKEFKKGRWIEGSGHLFMAGIRSNQLHNQLRFVDFQHILANLKTKIRPLSIVNLSNTQTDSLSRIMKYKDSGIYALHKAVEANDIEVVTIFLDAGMNINYRGSEPVKIHRDDKFYYDEDYSPVEIAIKKNLALMTSLLIKRGANLHHLRGFNYFSNNKYSGYHGWESAIYMAITQKSYEILKVFKDNKVDFNQMCKKNWDKTGHQVALESGDQQIISIIFGVK